VNTKKNTIEFSSPPKKIDETEVKDTDKSMEECEDSPQKEKIPPPEDSLD